MTWLQNLSVLEQVTLLIVVGLCVASAIIYLKYRAPPSELQSLITLNLSKIKSSALGIFVISALTYTLMSLEFSKSIAENLLNHNLLGHNMLWFSALLGAFGAFLAGSATVSNILFAELQWSSAQLYQQPVNLAIALQLIGAGAGNMIALPNILVVQAAVGLRNQEGFFLRKLWLPCLIYLGLATVVGILFFT